MHLQVPGGVPQMGAHWVDLLASEFNGGAFTRTFVWDSYDGEVAFMEPMVTKDGYYPTDCSVVFEEHPHEFRISLDGLTFHDREWAGPGRGGACAAPPGVPERDSGEPAGPRHRRNPLSGARARDILEALSAGGAAGPETGGCPPPKAN